MKKKTYAPGKSANGENSGHEKREERLTIYHKRCNSGQRNIGFFLILEGVLQHLEERPLTLGPGVYITDRI